MRVRGNNNNNNNNNNKLKRGNMKHVKKGKNKEQGEARV
jgi:hypothetical protein